MRKTYQSQRFPAVQKSKSIHSQKRQRQRSVVLEHLDFNFHLLFHLWMAVLHPFFFRSSLKMSPRVTNMFVEWNVCDSNVVMGHSLLWYFDRKRLLRDQIVLYFAKSSLIPFAAVLYFISGHLHGGLKGWNSKIWSVDAPSESGDVKDSNSNEASIQLSLTSPDLDEGFPGEVHCKVGVALFGFVWCLSASWRRRNVLFVTAFVRGGLLIASDSRLVSRKIDGFIRRFSRLVDWRSPWAPIINSWRPLIFPYSRSRTTRFLSFPLFSVLESLSIKPLRRRKASGGVTRDTTVPAKFKKNYPDHSSSWKAHLGLNLRYRT